MPTFKDWIAGRTAEGTPADADELYLRDDSGNVSKRVTWSGLKSALGLSGGVTAFAGTLLDDADAAAARTTLGADAAYLPVLVSGQYMAAATTSSTTNTGPESFMQGLPVMLPTCTLDRIGIEVTAAASAGGVYRLGIYDDDLSLVIDAGTVDVTTTGIKEITISQAITGGTYWLVGAQQGAPATGATVRQNSGIIINGGAHSAAAVSSQGSAGYTLAVVAGSLPATTSLFTGATRSLRVFVRVA